MTNKQKLHFLTAAMKYQHREAQRIQRVMRYGSIEKDLQTLIDHMEATLHSLNILEEGKE